MAYSQAQNRATQKYEKANYEPRQRCPLPMPIVSGGSSPSPLPFSSDIWQEALCDDSDQGNYYRHKNAKNEVLHMSPSRAFAHEKAGTRKCLPIHCSILLVIPSH